MKLLDVLNENNKEVKEQLQGILRGAAKNISKVKGAIDDVVKFALNSGQVIKNVDGVALATSDDIIKAMKSGTLGSTGASQLASGLLKSNRLPKDIQRTLVNEIAAGSKFKNVIGKVKTENALRKSLSKKGYTAETIELMVGRAKDQKIGPFAVVKKTPKKTTTTTTKKTTTTPKSTTTKAAATGTGTISKKLDDILNVLAGNSKKTVQGRRALQVAEKIRGSKLGRGLVSTVVKVGRFALIRTLLWWLLILGLGGYIIRQLWSQFWSEGDPIPSDDELLPLNDWMECIVTPLADDDNAEIIQDVNGVAVKYKIDEFGGKETGGHVIFTSDYRVKAANGIEGTWSCNQTGLQNEELNEQGLSGISTSTSNSGSTGVDISAKDMSRIIDQIEDNLNGDILDSDSTDLKDTYNIVKGLQNRSYKGRDAIRVLVKNYPKIKGKQLGTHILELENLDFEATELRDELLSLLGYSVEGGGSNDGGSNQSGDSDGGDGNSKTGLSHITVVWDGKDSGGKGKGIKYVPCDSFPFKIGCISDKIKDVQRCAGELKVDGYYGPKTDARLAKVIIGYSKTITKKSYDKITKECKGKKSDGVTKLKAVDPVTREKVSKIKPLEVKPIVLPKLDIQKMIKVHGPEKLENQINKTIDGKLIKDIIDNDIKFRGGRFVLKLKEELTENQLKAINYYFASKGFSLERKKETLKKGKYVWKAETSTARRIARKELGIEKLKDKQ
jgi:hypothetical protein